MENKNIEDVKISVIVPVFNLEKELARCVHSICRQSHRNIEIIIVDDGSEDSSREIINGLADEDKRIYPIFKENGGVTSARLAGVKVSSGQYVGFVDGDDEIEPDMYSELLNNALFYKADISHCGYMMCFADGRKNYFYNSGLIKEQDRNTAIVDLLEGRLVEPGLCNKLFDRSLFDDIFCNNRMDNNIRINEDLLMNYYLFKQVKKAVFEDICPYHYIVRETSATRQSLNKYRIYDPVKVKNLILSDCEEKLQKKAEEALVTTAIYTETMLSMEKFKGHKTDFENIRKVICYHKSAVKRLPLKIAIMGNMILYTPVLFRLLYHIYAETIQIKKYE